MDQSQPQASATDSASGSSSGSPLAATSLDQWLIRTRANELVGPYTQEQLCLLVREGELGPDDEVCRANHYWITLSETDEVMSQLGIQTPARRHDPDEEVTQTETQADMDTEEPTDPDLRVPNSNQDADIKVLRSGSSGGTFRSRESHVPAGDGADFQTEVEAEAGGRPSFWRNFGGLLAVFAILLVVIIYRIFKHRG